MGAGERFIGRLWQDEEIKTVDGEERNFRQVFGLV